MTFEEFSRRLREAGERRVDQAMFVEMGAMMVEAEALAKGRLSGDVLNPRSGNLRRSIVHRAVRLGPGRVEGAIRAGGGARDVRYARIHEEGGTIRPKKAGGFLAIPTARVPGGQTKQWPRAFPFLRFQPIRGGSMGLLVKDVGGRRARSEVWFILVRKAVIPRRPYLAPSMADATRDINGRMRAAMFAAVTP